MIGVRISIYQSTVMNVSFSAVSLNEGEGGVVRFTLDKTRGAVGDVSVRLFTIDDSAIGESLHHY